MEETVPSPRADSSRNAEEKGQPSLTEIPTRVWFFAIIAGILLFALFSLWGLYLFQGSLGAGGPTPTAIIWTATPTPIPAASPTPTLPQTPAGEGPGGATPTPSSAISVGGYVQVAGTGEYGLSLREGPGANYARMDVAGEGEVFIVVEGPQTAGGSPWWRIRAPENEERFWWAIGNYLQPIDHP